MKLAIESKGQGQATVTLNFNGKDYTEHWRYDYDNGAVCEDSIVNQIEDDGINAEGTIIEDVIDMIDIEEFIELADDEVEFS
ncbi:hypothetical protein [Clostridium sp. VAP51]|uniref:hypothetical protein n=1 Tax=Clostridium sp. VAP51 TaxID=2949978 RepID=UPI002079A3C6|nr:hypothetical protein [Clostridium sp. VAP51]